MKLRPLTTLALLAAGTLALAGCGGDAQAEQAGPSAPSPAAEESLPPDLPADYSGPRIDAPEVEPCPYVDEVGAVSGTAEQIDKALELGCELDIHGEITFTEPLPGDVYALISTEHALSVQEMCDEGYMHPEDCEVELG